MQLVGCQNHMATYWLRQEEQLGDHDERRMVMRSRADGSRSTTWIGAAGHCQTPIPGTRVKVTVPRLPSTATLDQPAAIADRSVPWPRTSSASTAIVS